MIKDCSKMTENQLLRELVRLFIGYDKARDRYVWLIHKELEKAGVDYESLPRLEWLHMENELSDMNGDGNEIRRTYG